jgi:hypothetical protein
MEQHVVQTLQLGRELRQLQPGGRKRVAAEGRRDTRKATQAAGAPSHSAKLRDQRTTRHRLAKNETPLQGVEA